MEKILLQLTMQSRKRKIKDDSDFLEFCKPYKKRKIDEDDEDIEYEAILNTNFVSHLVPSKKRRPRALNRVRNKEWWKSCYRRWSGKDFKKDLRVTRATFNLILDVIAPYIFKEPTNLNSEPISVDRQLGLTLYRLGHSVSYSTLSQLLGISISLASETFNKVCRVLFATSYDQYVTLPKTDEE